MCLLKSQAILSLLLSKQYNLFIVVERKRVKSMGFIMYVVIELLLLFRWKIKANVMFFGASKPLLSCIDKADIMDGRTILLET